MGFQEWETPSWLFELVERTKVTSRFTLDVCATVNNTKCAQYYTPEQDGLKQPWAPNICWCNPPYGNIGPWVDKAIMEMQAGAIVIMLLPANTNTKWFKRCQEYGTVFFISRRIGFLNAVKRMCKANPRPGILVRFDNGEPHMIYWEV